MSATPFWLTPSRPVCDIPWYGTAVVLANGTVHFCCHSVASPGNVNEKSFDELWNGPMLRRVRETLTRGDFPQECRTSDCPIYRGDEHGYVRSRTEGVKAPLPGFSEAITQAELFVAPDAASARLSLVAAARLKPCDVVAGLRFPDGRIRFLPDLEPIPVPCARLEEVQGDFSLELESRKGPLAEAGEYKLCVALFLPDSNPSIPANCLWACEKEFVVNLSYGTKARARPKAHPGHHDRAGDLSQR